MRFATQNLDSYRLAQYAVQVPCYICGGGNMFDAELCHHCCAPMALTHQSQVDKVQPRMLATIGASGAGKTVYLGMLLDMLSRQSDDLQILARGAFSITLQQSVMGALATGRFPQKTPNEPDRWNWVHCQVKWQKQRRPMDLVMPDMAGEAMLEEIERPHTYPVVRSLLEKSAGALVLIDTVKLLDGTLDQDYFSMKLLTYLLELAPDSRRGWCQRPLALVFAKADQAEAAFDDPNEFSRRRAPGLWQLCQERFKQVRFFASGVAGGCAYRVVRGGGRVRVPLRIEPRGIVEPFEWLVHKADK